MKQRQRWPAELRAAIDAADAEGIPPNRILKLAKSGDLDGISQSFALPESTFFDILAKGRAARISSTDPVKPGEEEEAAGAILRRALEIAKRELAKVDAALSDPRKPASERATLTRTLDILIRTIRGYENKAATAKPRSRSQLSEAQERAKDARANPLSDFVRDHERRLSERPAPGTTRSDSGKAGGSSVDVLPDETTNDKSNGHGGFSSVRAPSPAAT